MNILNKFLSKLRKSELAQGLIEYGIILALISIVTVGAVGSVGNDVSKTLDKVNDPEVTVKIDEGYIPIATAEDMNNIRNGETQTFGKGSPWEGTYTSGLDQKYLQVSDINLSKLEWDPINEFTGTYEGSGLSIRKLKVDSEGSSSGLFGEVKGATLKDINLEDVSVQGTDSTGGLAGIVSEASNLQNISVTGEVKHKGSNKNLGGIVGEMTGQSTLTNSYSNVIVNGQDNIGGLVGNLQSSRIFQSYSNGTLDGNNTLGGLIGLSGSKSLVEESYSNVVLISSGEVVGGLVGKDEGVTVERSYWDVNKSGQTITAEDKGEGKTSYEMTLARTFEGWNFEDVWKIEEGVNNPAFDGENVRLDDMVVTFVDDQEKKYPVTGIVGATLTDYHDGEIPKLSKDGHKQNNWIDREGKDFDMDTKLTETDLTVAPKWVLNKVVKKQFYPSEEKNKSQTANVKIDDMYELDSYDVDKGKIELSNRDGVNLEFKLSDRPHDRRVQTGGKETLADSKTVIAQNTKDYDSEGYTGTLDRYHYSGVITPADTKDVSGQTSSNYDDGTYTGTLSRYLYSGIVGDTKSVSGQMSSNYNSGGYTGTLDRYLQSGSYTASDTKDVSGHTSASYDSGGYTGTLIKYLYSGGYTPAHSKMVTESGSMTISSTREKVSATSSTELSYSLSDTKSYNSGGYSGRLNATASATMDLVNKLRAIDAGKIDNYNIGDRYTVSATITGTFSGTVTRPSSDNSVYRYKGKVTRPASDTRVWRYSGNVTRPDTSVYRYQGTVTRPASDNRVYKYKGTVNRPYSDTRTWDHYYMYGVTVSYIPK